MRYPCGNHTPEPPLNPRDPKDGLEAPQMMLNSQGFPLNEPLIFIPAAVWEKSAMRNPMVFYFGHAELLSGASGLKPSLATID